MMKSPAERIRLIEDSLACWVYGWCSFIPLLGIPFLVLATRKFHQTRIEIENEWNPGSRYLNWGMILAVLGGLLSLIQYGLVFVGILKSLA